MTAVSKVNDIIRSQYLRCRDSSFEAQSQPRSMQHSWFRAYDARYNCFMRIEFFTPHYRVAIYWQKIHSLLSAFKVVSTVI